MSAPILKIFDPNLPARLKIDASSEGVGTILEQNQCLLKNRRWRLIGYSFCTLRDYKKRYAQSEKEIFSIVLE